MLELLAGLARFLLVGETREAGPIEGRAAALHLLGYGTQRGKLGPERGLGLVEQRVRALRLSAPHLSGRASRLAASASLRPLPSRSGAAAPATMSSTPARSRASCVSRAIGSRPDPSDCNVMSANSATELAVWMRSAIGSSTVSIASLSLTSPSVASFAIIGRACLGQGGSNDVLRALIGRMASASGVIGLVAGLVRAAPGSLPQRPLPPRRRRSPASSSATASAITGSVERSRVWPRAGSRR